MERKQTRSEYICREISKKFFFGEFVYNNLYTYETGDKNEICDCLIGFQDWYLVIQIKERDTDAQSSDDTKWLKRNTRDAIKQLRTTLNRWNYMSGLDIRNSYGDKIDLDFTKTIIPLVIFDDDTIKDYYSIFKF